MTVGYVISYEEKGKKPLYYVCTVSNMLADKKVNFVFSEDLESASRFLSPQKANTFIRHILEEKENANIRVRNMMIDISKASNSLKARKYSSQMRLWKQEHFIITGLTDFETKRVYLMHVVSLGNLWLPVYTANIDQAAVFGFEDAKAKLESILESNFDNNLESPSCLTVCPFKVVSVAQPCVCVTEKLYNYLKQDSLIDQYQIVVKE